MSLDISQLIQPERPGCTQKRVYDALKSQKHGVEASFLAYDNHWTVSDTLSHLLALEGLMLAEQTSAGNWRCVQ